MSMTSLKRLFRAIEQEASENPKFAERIQSALHEERFPARSSGRRQAAVVDPQQLVEVGGEEGLRAALLPLTVDRLKDVIAQYGMDPQRLALKWKTHARLLD